MRQFSNATFHDQMKKELMLRAKYIATWSILILPVCCLSCRKSVTQRRLDDELFNAIRVGNVVLAKKALLKGADVNGKRWFMPQRELGAVPFSYTSTPLHDAARIANTEMTKLLIAAGAKVNKTDNCGRTPLFCAASADGPNQSYYNWEWSPHISHNGLSIVPTSPLEVSKDYKAVAEILIIHGAKVSSSDRTGATALHYAAISNRKEIAALLISNGANVNARSKQHYTPLHCAAALGHKDIVDLLLANGAKVNVLTKHISKYFLSHTPLFFALEELQKDVVRQLRMHDATLSRQEQATINEALINAVRSGDSARVREILEKGAEPNGKAPNGNVPLHAAIEEGHKEIVELLIISGADVNAHTNWDGFTLLHKAVYRGKRDIAELLINKGANLEAIDSDNLTPLWRAVTRKRLETARLLIANDADVNIKDEQGETLLHWTERHYGYNEFAALLRSAGAMK